MKTTIILTSLLCFSSFGFSQIDKQRNIVPDAKTAKKIAEVVCFPIYGKSIYKEMPFNATLVGDSVWVVKGSMPKSKIINGYAYVTFGGVLYVEIRKSDCKIIKVTHGK